jgi:hypothetical protein
MTSSVNLPSDSNIVPIVMNEAAVLADSAVIFLLVTYFILATSRSHACAFGFLLTDNHFSAFNCDSSYLSLE